MESYRPNSIKVGIYFIFATVFYSIGQLVHGPITGAVDILDIVYPHRSTIIFGVLVELIGRARIINLQRDN